MNLKEVRSRLDRANALHEKNYNRLEKKFWAKLGMMLGLVVAMAGAMVVALVPGAGPALTFGAVMTGVGAASVLGLDAWNIGLSIADKKALKQLKKEFPEYVDQNARGFSVEFSRDVVNGLTGQEIDKSGNKEFYVENEGMQEDMYENYRHSYGEDLSIHSDRFEKYDRFGGMEDRERFD